MEKTLTRQEIQAYKRRLLEELALHAREVGEIERTALEPSGGARFQPVDESIEEAELDEDLDVLSVEDKRGYEVREALDRIVEGTFGRCEECEHVISRKRLQMLPYARLCHGCAKDREGVR